MWENVNCLTPRPPTSSNFACKRVQWTVSWKLNKIPFFIFFPFASHMVILITWAGGETGKLSIIIHAEFSQNSFIQSLTHRLLSRVPSALHTANLLGWPGRIVLDKTLDIIRRVFFSFFFFFFYFRRVREMLTPFGIKK